MIIRIETHPSDRDFLVAHTPPDFAHHMGRFAAARFSQKLKGYVINAELLDQLRTFARHEGASILDERDRGAAEKFAGPLPECRSCGQPSSRKASLALNRCTNCGDVWHPVVYEAPGSASTRLECTSCGRRQQLGGRFCGNCGADMPAAPPPAPRPIEIPNRPHNQDPLPIGQVLAEQGLIPDLDEEPERERYP